VLIRSCIVIGSTQSEATFALVSVIEKEAIEMDFELPRA
jgi:hypothetical protein